MAFARIGKEFFGLARPENTLEHASQSYSLIGSSAIAFLHPPILEKQCGLMLSRRLRSAEGASAGNLNPNLHNRSVRAVRSLHARVPPTARSLARGKLDDLNQAHVPEVSNLIKEQ